MARLPIPGKDGGTWGDILNDFLSQAHAANGTLKTDSVTAAHLANGSVKTVSLSDGAVTDAKVADSADISQSKIAGLTTSLAGKADVSHAHTSDDLSDSTVVGRSLMTAADAAAARTAIGAGTSNLVLGTTAGTAKAGDYQPTADDITETATNKVFTTSERTKLTGIASGATANATDSDLRDRSTHTGTQTASTINDLTERIGDDVANLLVAGTNVTLDYNDAANTLTVNASLVSSANTFVTTIGRTGAGATYECDGVSDDVQIQAAINAVTMAGGGVIKILSGTYDIRTMIVVPKDPKIRIEGDYTTKAGYGGTTLKASTSLVTPLDAILKEAGNAVADTSNADHSHASHYSRLVIDGNGGKATTGLLLYNTDHTIVSDCKFTGLSYGIDGQYNGTVALSDYAGGLRVQNSSFLASTVNLRLDSHTQDWITDSWFLGTPQTHVQLIRSNKIHFSNNEFNTVVGQTFVFDDDGTLPTGSVNVTGGFINAGTGMNFWVDNRTNAGSKGIIFAGVRFVQGTKTKLFQQDKEPQVSTYTSADLSGGYIYANYNDDVILLNASSAPLPLQLPSAASATKNIFVKAINVTNAVTIVANGSDTIEQDGSFVATLTFSEVNQSVLLTPDGTKWRALGNYKPSGGSGSTTENVIEVSTNYTIPTDKDIILVNANSSALTMTLPSKATKYTAARKNFVVKVISATNPVTIVAAGADEIDATGQTSIVVNDLRAVTFVANSGSRWRTYSSAMTGATTFKRTATTVSTNSSDTTIIGVTDTTAARTITLRTADTIAGRTYTVKDESGAAAAHPITVACQASQKIDGVSTYSISTNYGSVTVYSDGSNWFVIASR